MSESRKSLRALLWTMPFLAAMLPIVLLSVYSLRVSSQSVSDLVEAANQAAVTNVSQLISGDITKIVSLAHALASVPGSVQAAKTLDDQAMRIRLKAVVLAYPQVERVFVTDKTGILWADFPSVPGSFGSKMGDSPWVKAVTENHKPFISGVYLPFEGASSPVVAIAVPILDQDELVGILVCEYRTVTVTRWLQNIRLGKSGYTFVIDQNGVAVGHPAFDSKDSLLQEYASVSRVQQALANNYFTDEYTDPLNDKRMIGTFLPISIGHNYWAVIAAQPIDEAYSVLNQVKLQIQVAGLVLTIITLGMVITLGIMTARNQRLNRALQSKNQTLQDITSFVSHQLRAPVTAMRWTIEGMVDGDDGPVSDALKISLGKLKDVAIQNGKLIDDILNVSRIDRGVIEVDTHPTPLKDVAERAMRDYHIAAEKAGLTLTAEGLEQAITVMADKEKMAESVTNAISNAIKHTKQGGITLRLRTDGQYGYIDVTDTGEGMPPEIMNNLFSRTGISGKNTDSAQSTGLGLYIARNFMQMQKGDITVSSEIGKGSTFSYKVPLAG